MRARSSWRSVPGSPRLWVHRAEERPEFWTETAGDPPAVYGERWTTLDGRTLRAFEPARSKLSTAVVKGYDGPMPRPGERWLYLGAASGTTASHVADLLGPTGRLYAVERSLRPFARLVRVAERWPELRPILGDARLPEAYADRVPIVDGIYADIAQPDQVELLRENVRWFLDETRGVVVVALKTATMGRGVSGAAHRQAAEAALSAEFDLAPAVRLDPFFRSHYLLGGAIRARSETRGEGKVRSQRHEEVARGSVPRPWRRPARRPPRAPGRREPYARRPTREAGPSPRS